jgi:inner membrane transporter RhtA
MQRAHPRSLPGWSIPLVFVVGAVSQYVGAAIGVFLFETTEPATVAWLRAAAAAIALLAWRRPWRRGLSRRQAGFALVFGLVTIGMNVAIYEAMSRIPLGTAVAIEFLGPTVVAALGSRRRRDLAAVALASAGVLLLAGVEFHANLTGVLFALISAAMWPATSCSASGWPTPATVWTRSLSGCRWQRLSSRPRFAATGAHRRVGLR